MSWLFGRIGVIGIVIAILAALLVLQTVRLEGFKIWPFSFEGWKPMAQSYAKASKEAKKLAKEEREKQEQKFKDKSERIDRELADAKASVDDAVSDYTATHRVRACPSSRPAVATAESGGAESSNGPGGTPELVDGVVVNERDIAVCTTNTLRLEAARKWGLELNN